MTTYTQEQREGAAILLRKLAGQAGEATAIFFNDVADILAAPSTSQPLTKDQLESLVDDLAQWSSYVEVDTAPTTLTKHVEKVLAAHNIKGGA